MARACSPTTSPSCSSTIPISTTSSPRARSSNRRRAATATSRRARASRSSPAILIDDRAASGGAASEGRESEVRMMRVLHVASEVAPFAQSGGLADVVAGLPAALADSHGLDVAVAVPLYRGVAAKLAAAKLALGEGEQFAIDVGPHHFDVRVRPALVGRVRYGFVDCPPLFDRGGTLYGPGGAGEFADNHVRFAALGKAALAWSRPDILHVQHWQGAPAAIYSRLAGKPPAIVTTIHNLAYRGIYPKSAVDELGLPWLSFNIHDFEFYDQLCLLKGGLAAADAVTTVSPTYAHEIMTPERGEALDGFLRSDVHRLVGIVNG